MKHKKRFDRLRFTSFGCLLLMSGVGYEKTGKTGSRIKRRRLGCIKFEDASFSQRVQNSIYHK